MKLLIVSDIHGNWPALETVLDAESGADRILCLATLEAVSPPLAWTWSAWQYTEAAFATTRAKDFLSVCHVCFSLNPHLHSIE